MSDYKISQATVDDVDNIVDMHVKSWVEAYTSPENGVSEKWVRNRISRHQTKEGKQKRKEFIEESYNNPDYYLRVAKDKTNKVVGFIDARRGEASELCGLYIDSSAYGSGVAKELAEPAIEWLGNDNDIKLSVVSYNLRAINFYMKLGFVVIEGSERKYDNTPLRVVDMVRKGGNL